MELNLNGIPAPRSFSNSELEAILMQTIKIIRPVEWWYYVKAGLRGSTAHQKARDGLLLNGWKYVDEFK